MNKLLLLGRLTRDVELRQSTGGTTIGKAGIAVNTFRGKDKEDDVLFLDFVAFGKTAENLARHLGKGKPVLLEGRLNFNTWQAQDGTKRSKHEMVIDRFEFLPKTADQTVDEAPPKSSDRKSGGMQTENIPF
jgi:single-strand DNA-binding protein